MERLVKAITREDAELILLFLSRSQLAGHEVPNFMRVQKLINHAAGYLDVYETAENGGIPNVDDK